MIFADNCFLFAQYKAQMLKIIGDAIKNLNKRSLGWKEGEMELISWGLDGSIGDVKIVEDGKAYMIKEVDSLRTLGALIKKEADSLSAMRFRMNKADKAMWMDMKFLREQRNCGRKETQKIQGDSAIMPSSLM